MLVVPSVNGPHYMGFTLGRFKLMPLIKVRTRVASHTHTRTNAHVVRRVVEITNYGNFIERVNKCHVCDVWALVKFTIDNILICARGGHFCGGHASRLL